MGRRRVLLEDFIAIASKFPWWLGVVAAAMSYAVLHHFANAAATSATEIGGIVVAAGAKTAARLFQYVVPIAFLVGAALSAKGARMRHGLHERAAASGMPAIAQMSWREFEMLIGEIFRRRGFRVAERGGQGADGGVDLVLWRDGERHLVQCKHWRAAKVPVAVVRELYGVMAAHGAAGGFVVAAGNFTGDARDFARGRNIELIGGKALVAMLAEVAGTPVRSVEPAGHVETGSDSSRTPRCPRCGEPMVKRTARHGTNAGKPFWGCRGFPACRGIRDAS